MRAVQVALPVPLPQCFTYMAPKEIPLGAVVSVPFGKRTLWGVIWEEALHIERPFPLKAVHKIHHSLFFSSGMRRFLQIMATYTMSTLGNVMKMAFPSLHYDRLILLSPNLSLGPFHPTKSRAKSSKIVVSEAQAQLLREGISAPPSFWQENLGLTWAMLRKWVDHGLLSLLAPFQNPESGLGQFFIQENTPLALTPDQKQALIKIQSASPTPFLLEGVTGAGKTEVALALCQQVWQQGKQVLVLLPEIALSHQWEKRCHTYFKFASEGSSQSILCGLWHSGLTPSARQRVFEGLSQGTLPLVIGARSALCLPYRNLGLIIVDEEHDASYKQSEGVLYHGRDMAITRAFCEKIPILLLSATPSLEVLRHVNEGRYGHVCLKSRYGPAQLPSFHIIDMTPHPPKGNAWLSPPLRQALADTLVRKEQSLLFLNRRGYASLLLCFQCGHREECPHCSAWLNVHSARIPRLLCHYCGFTKPPPSACPRCAHAQGMVAMGAGIEKIQQEVLSFLPQARIALLSSDHATSSQSLHELLTRMAAGEIDIMIGTQLLAKGHHFPFLTCIGIVDTDSALADMDFRARERLFQLLSQVSGRAGRAGLPGHTYLQTLQPHEIFFQHLATRNGAQLIQEEIEYRKLHDLPPFSRFAFITLSGLSEWDVQDAALTLQQKAPSYPNLTLWGPAPAPLNPLRRRWRWRFILKASRSAPLQSWIAHWLEAVPLPKSIKVEKDIDPYHFL